MQKGRKNRLTGQAGEYLVCAELARRGFIATSFTGNVPEFDLIIADDKLKTIPIQVKTSSGNKWPTKASLWINIEFDEDTNAQIDKGNADISNPSLVYVCVVLSKPGDEKRDRFFVLRKEDLQVICANNYRNWMDGLQWKRPKNPRSLDNRYEVKDLERFEDNWGLIEGKLASNGIVE